MFNLSSDEEAEAGGGVVAKKVKKAKKDPMTASATKKQVKFKDEKPTTAAKKKPRIKNTWADVKRKARIVNTDPNIKGPGVKEAPQKGDANNVRKAEQKKIETKKLETSLESVQRPEKSVPKPPEIIDLEAQLMALSKDVELSKGETKGYGFSKPSSPAQKPAKSSPSIQVMIMIIMMTMMMMMMIIPGAQTPVLGARDKGGEAANQRPAS